MKTKLTYLGGATYLIEIGSFRLLTDPGFDPEGTERSEGPGHELKKTMGPAIAADAVGPIDAVLLSHAQHYDNLDNSAKAMLPLWGRVLTTPESAEALGGNTEALGTWESTELTNRDGERIRVTATPAIHTNNAEIRGEIGETTGFVLEWEGQENGALYLSGDTVWTDEIEEIGERFEVGTAILNMGAANVPAVGDIRLTMNGEEGARVTSTLGVSNAYPAHFEGWLHYKQGRDGIAADFERAGVRDRLQFLDPGESAEPAV
jgi:L-ascorbate metabolism protein UlaG (beta-lactamase superfamily)